MTLVGLFFSVVSMRLEGSFFGGDLALAGRMIMAEVGQLRGESAHTRKDRILRLNLADQTLYSFAPQQKPEDQLAEEEWGRRRLKRLPREVSLVDVVTPTGKVQEGEAEIRFYASGRVERSMIHVKDEEGANRTFEINPLTGVVTIHEGYVERKAG